MRLRLPFFVHVESAMTAFDLWDLLMAFWGICCAMAVIWGLDS